MSWKGGVKRAADCSEPKGFVGVSGGKDDSGEEEADSV